MYKKNLKIKGMTLVEIIVATVIAGIVLTGITMIYFYSMRASKQGLERGEAQQALNNSMDQILKDLRMVGADVTTTTSGSDLIDKATSIDNAGLNSIALYGNFDDENDSGGITIEYVRYFIENNTALVRSLYYPTSPGSGTWDLDNPSDKVLIGKRPTGVSKIKITRFELYYVSDLDLTPHPNPTDTEKQLLTRVDIIIEISDHDGEKLVFGSNSSGTLRNFQR